MKAILTSLVCTMIMASVSQSWANERLIYAIVYKGPDYSAAKTEIYSIDLQTARSSKLFSDGKISIILPQHLYSLDFPVSGGNRIYAVACQKTPAGRPMIGTEAFYQLFTDGSNSFKKIAPVSERTQFKNAFINATGTLVGSISWQKLHQYLFVNDAGLGELLHQVCLDSIFLDCYASSIGWLPGSDKIFFTLEIGDDDGTSAESYNRVGSYIMNVADRKVIKLPVWTKPEESRQLFSARLLGILPTGEMMYYHYKTLFRVSPAGTDSFKAEAIDFNAIAGLAGYGAGFTISPSGRYIAAVNKLLSAQDTINNIWLKDLKTGDESVLFSLPANQFNGPFLGLVGWVKQ